MSETATREDRNRLWAPVWQPVTFPPAPALADLRQRVLARSDRRCPKWGFRLAADLAVQIQPRPAAVNPLLPFDVAFEGELLFAPAGFGSEPFREGWGWGPAGIIWLKFAIRSQGRDLWRLKVYRIMRHTQPYGPADVVAVRDRLADTFRTGRWESLDPDMMLSPRCLMCGRVLTDAASRARLIGPECAGDSSLTVPGLQAVAGAETE